jgi:hypothetical protein
MGTGTGPQSALAGNGALAPTAVWNTLIEQGGPNSRWWLPARSGLLTAARKRSIGPGRTAGRAIVTPRAS